MSRLYYTDAYCQAFDAQVVRAFDHEGRPAVVLDRTAFYPTSGGQPFDLGVLGAATVVDVVDVDGDVVHVLSSPLPDGAAVHGQIDWARRFDHMQQHTGQHLLSAVIAERIGLATVSVHFGRDSATLDLDGGSLSPAQVVEAETAANVAVAENRPVSVTFEDAATAAGLRKAADREGTLRIITIEGLDRSACGGTHVRATGEIGPIAIRKVERVKQHVRLEFLCGQRAVRRARADADLLSAIAAAHSTTAEELPSLLEGQRAELKAQVLEIRPAEIESRPRLSHTVTLGETYVSEPAPAAPSGSPPVQVNVHTQVPIVINNYGGYGYGYGYGGHGYGYGGRGYGRAATPRATPARTTSAAPIKVGGDFPPPRDYGPRALR